MLTIQGEEIHPIALQCGFPATRFKLELVIVTRSLDNHFFFTSTLGNLRWAITLVASCYRSPAGRAIRLKPPIILFVFAKLSVLIRPH